MSEMSKEIEDRVRGFRDEYVKLCEKYKIYLGSCSCCGGLFINTVDADGYVDETFDYLDGELDPNGWGDTDGDSNAAS